MPSYREHNPFVFAMSSFKKLLFLLLLFSVGLPQVALARLPSPRDDLALRRTSTMQSDLPVVQRHQKGFEAVGVHEGNWVILPDVSLSEAYDSNIYALPGNEKSDFATVLTPRLRARTLSSTMGMTIDAHSRHGRYQSLRRENFNDYSLAVAPYWQINHAVKLNLAAVTERNHDLRTDETDTVTRVAAEPPVWYRNRGQFDLVYQPGRMGVAFSGGASTLRYENVRVLNSTTPVITNDRDRDDVQGDVSFLYDVTPKTHVFARLGMLARDYNRRDFIPLLGGYLGPSRDSTITEQIVGIAWPLTYLVKFEGEGGFYQQNFSTALLKDVQTPVGKAALRWSPTRLTDIRASTKRQVFETIQPNASNYVQSTVGIDVTHELLRPFVIQVGFEIGKNDYRGIARTDRFHYLHSGATYKMNRNMHLQADYAYGLRDSTDPLFDFDKHRVMVTARVQF